MHLGFIKNGRKLRKKEPFPVCAVLPKSSTWQKASSPDEKERYKNSTTGQNEGTHTNTMTGGEVPVESVAITE
eukprot:7103696-Ditylum_brightwellii.AAC.1